MKSAGRNDLARRRDATTHAPVNLGIELQRVTSPPSTTFPGSPTVDRVEFLPGKETFVVNVDPVKVDPVNINHGLPYAAPYRQGKYFTVETVISPGIWALAGVNRAFVGEGEH